MEQFSREVHNIGKSHTHIRSRSQSTASIIITKCLTLSKLRFLLLLLLLLLFQKHNATEDDITKLDCFILLYVRKEDKIRNCGNALFCPIPIFFQFEQKDFERKCHLENRLEDNKLISSVHL